MTADTKRLPDDPPPPRLLGDTRGATMVMGIFMAVLLVGMLYYLMGIGETIVYRERMQDAADSGAFAAAVMHARGMNILALINEVIGAILGVLVALKITYTLLYMGAAVATGICAACAVGAGCWACPIAATLATGGEYVREHTDEVEPRIISVVNIAHSIADAVAIGYPLAAEAKVIQLGARTYHEPTSFGFMLPVARQLPVEDDDSSFPCYEAGRQAALLFPVPMVGYPLSAVLPGWRGLIGSLASTFSGYFCGGGNGKAKRVVTGAKLGDDHFEVRAVMIGDPKLDWSCKGVAIATWGAEDGSGGGGGYAILEKAAKVSFAQAEFYYDDGDYGSDVDRREWLWHMNWRARLRRFSLGSGGSAMMSACSTFGGGDCGVLDGLGDISNVVVH